MLMCRLCIFLLALRCPLANFTPIALSCSKLRKHITESADVNNRNHKCSVQIHRAKFVSETDTVNLQGDLQTESEEVKFV